MFLKESCACVCKFKHWEERVVGADAPSPLAPLQHTYILPVCQIAKKTFGKMFFNQLDASLFILYFFSIILLDKHCSEVYFLFFVSLKKKKMKDQLRFG